MKTETDAALTCVCGHSSKSHRKGDSIQNTPCDECWNAAGVEKPCSEFRVRHTTTEPPAAPDTVRDELNDLEALAKKWIAEHPCSFVVLEQKDGSTESETEYHTRLMVAFGYAATKSLRTELAEAVTERDALRELIDAASQIRAISSSEIIWSLEKFNGTWYAYSKAPPLAEPTALMAYEALKQSGGDGGAK